MLTTNFYFVSIKIINYKNKKGLNKNYENIKFKNK